MAIVVEHEKRKKEILEKSLDIFIEEGYEDVTFQKIADRCGITRTTLYIYFRNKREIFQASIKQLTQQLESDLNGTMTGEGTATEKLSGMLKQVLNVCHANNRLFNVLLPYLMQQKKQDRNPSESIRRRTLRLRHYMTNVLLEGMRNGEFRELNVKTMNEMFYGIIEAGIVRLSIMNDRTVEELYPVIDAAIEGIRK